MTKHLIDIAYEIASKKLKSKQFSFRELFKLIIEKHPEYKNDVGDLYIELINDTRFLSTGKDKWTLTEYLKFDDIQKISSSMFGLDKYTLDDDLDDDLKELLVEGENLKETEKEDMESYSDLDQDDEPQDNDNIAYGSSEMEDEDELIIDEDDATEEEDDDEDEDLEEDLENEEFDETMDDDLE